MRDFVVFLGLLSVFVMHQWVSSSGAHQAFPGSPASVNGAPKLTGLIYDRRGLNPNVNHLLFGRRSNRADDAVVVKATEEEADDDGSRRHPNDYEDADDRPPQVAMLARMRNDLLRSIYDDDDLDKLF